jgi:hypothetical protein
LALANPPIDNVLSATRGTLCACRPNTYGAAEPPINHRARSANAESCTHG